MILKEVNIYILNEIIVGEYFNNSYGFFFILDKGN